MIRVNRTLIILTNSIVAACVCLSILLHFSFFDISACFQSITSISCGWETVGMGIPPVHVIHANTWDWGPSAVLGPGSLLRGKSVSGGSTAT